MKNLILLIAVMVLSACASMPTVKSVVGTYEGKNDGRTQRVGFLENGDLVSYKNGKKEEEEAKWKLTKEGKIHVTAPDEETLIFRINKDGSINLIAIITKDGNRYDTQKEKQYTYKKIKPETKETPSKGDDNNSTTAKPAKELTLKERTVLKERAVGTYEIKNDRDTHRVVLLENGILEAYLNGKKEEKEGKWKLTKEGELHLTEPIGNIVVARINKDRSLTVIAMIPKDGKRKEAPKEKQKTLKKIK